FNGKTTFMNAFGSLFGDRCEIVTLSDITQRFGIEKLVNADFIIADESSARFEDTSRLKQILEGTSTNIEGKGTAAYTGLIDAKVIIATNRLSTSLISDSGIARRVEIINTPNSFNKQEDNDLKNKLLLIKPTILNWAISVIPGMIKNMTKYKQGIKDRTEKLYRDNESPFNNFIAIYCQLEGECRLDELVVAYEKYRIKYQTRVMNSLSIGHIISNDYPDIIKNRNVKSTIHKGKSTIKYEGFSINDNMISRNLEEEEYKNNNISSLF
ncbi:hypothetical protein LCGC14_1723260, partial [marine sediment metagenome]